MRSFMFMMAAALFGLTVAAVPAMAKEHPAKHNHAATEPTTRPADEKHHKNEARHNHHTATTQPTEDQKH